MKKLKGAAANAWRKAFVKHSLELVQTSYMHLPPANIVAILEGVNQTLVTKTGRGYSA